MVAQPATEGYIARRGQTVSKAEGLGIDGRGMRASTAGYRRLYSMAGVRLTVIRAIRGIRDSTAGDRGPAQTWDKG